MTTRSLIVVTSAAAAVVCLSLVASTAFAFGGCVDSPENPTWILAGIGGAAAGLPWLRAKIRARRNRRN